MLLPHIFVKAELFSYTLEKANPKHKIALHRMLYGYEDVSNKGKYRYHRKGLIDELAGKKFNRGVFIIPKQHKKQILAILRKNKATVKTLHIAV